MDVVRRIHASAATAQRLTPPVTILATRRLPAPAGGPDASPGGVEM
jgi:hypothetical protein